MSAGTVVFKALRWIGLALLALIVFAYLASADYEPHPFVALGALIFCAWWGISARIDALRRDLTQALDIIERGRAP